MFPRRPTRRRRGGRAGYTLVEVVVAMLISCIMVTAVFGVAMTSKLGGGSGMHKAMAQQGMAQVSAQLKQYVTACGCNPKTGACPAKCSPSPANSTSGPNLSDANTWAINGNGGIADFDSSGNPNNGWALMCGEHYLTGVVPPLEQAPFNAGNIAGSVISYNVIWTNNLCGNGNNPGPVDSPGITFSSQWSEP